MTTGIESCAGGVGESLTALQGIESGSSHQVADAIGVASYGASNCTLASSQPLDDLASYQVTESLARFHLAHAVDGIVSWADPDHSYLPTHAPCMPHTRPPHTSYST